MRKIPNHISNKFTVDFFRILLRQKNLRLQPIPPSRPVFIGPTETEGKIWYVSLENSLQRHFQETFIPKSIIVITESINAIPLCKVGLLRHHRIHPQVVE